MSSNLFNILKFGPKLSVSIFSLLGLSIKIFHMNLFHMCFHALLTRIFLRGKKKLTHRTPLVSSSSFLNFSSLSDHNNPSPLPSLYLYAHANRHYIKPSFTVFSIKYNNNNKTINNNVYKKKRIKQKEKIDKEGDKTHHTSHNL